MTRREQQGLGRGGIWGELLDARDEEWLDLVATHPGEPADWRMLARRGGFPLPASLSTRRSLVVTWRCRSRIKRLIRSPKLYWGDTGMALHLTQEAEPGGAHLENLVLNDLLTWRDARLDRAEVFYWRTSIGEEVDFVIETGDRLLPFEVKATERPRLRDIAHLRAFRAEYGDKARAGLLLHAGATVEWLAPDVLAAPWWSVL